VVSAQLVEGARCVQSQLTAAGFDPGPIDGQPGRKTREALNAFQKERKPVTEHTLDLALGNAICRQIGLIDPSLREFWPANETHNYQIVFGPSVSVETRNRIKDSAAYTYKRMKEVFQVKLAGRDTIVVGSNSSELKALISEYAQVEHRETSRSIADACGSFRGISGRVLPGLMWICVSDDPEVQASIEQTWLDFFVAHEATHLLQYQLGGAINVGHSADKVLNRHGPVWLTEGVAQAFGNKVALNTPDWDYRIVNYRRLENRFPELSELEYERVVQSRKPEVYRAGTVGAIDLIDLYGYPAIATFYANLGQGAEWKEAFESAFGVSVDTFYSHYKEVTRFSDNGDPLEGPLTTLSK